MSQLHHLLVGDLLWVAVLFPPEIVMALSDSCFGGVLLRERNLLFELSSLAVDLCQPVPLELGSLV